MRGDVLYGFFQPRTQATIDLILYILFFIPGVVALTYAGYFFAAESLAIREHLEHHRRGRRRSIRSRSILPLAGTFLLLQGIVEIIRCVICIRQGAWPSREEDVEEVDVDKLKEMVHVKDEDIARLDAFVAPTRELEMKIRKELWFGFTLMAIILVAVLFYTPWAGFVDGHLGHDDLGALGLLMLALIVVAIMLGFPTAFTLMGMGVFFGWLAYRSVNPALANQQILDLMVQRAYSVMSNDVLIAIPLFVFMGYLVERANLIEKLFKSLHLSLAPGAGRAGGGDDRHLRDLRHGHRHRRRGGHADGPAGAAGDAARRLQRAALGRRDHRRRMPRHPDSAVGAADRLRRDRRGVGRASCTRARSSPG